MAHVKRRCSVFEFEYMFFWLRFDTEAGLLVLRFGCLAFRVNLLITKVWDGRISSSRLVSLGSLSDFTDTMILQIL